MPLFTWNWSTTFNGTSGGVKKAKNLGTIDPGSGTGGVTVISVNGIPTPNVAVTPSSTSITTGQTLPVSVSVGGEKSNSAATGSVQSTSGSYKSASIGLSDGTATIAIPAGSLPTGIDTLTVAYTPDKSSAAVLSASSGFALVTVIQSPPAATPKLSPTPGTFTSAQSVKISDATTGATIYYTLDGSTPTSHSTKYISALTIAKTSTVKAIAEAVGYPNSAVGSATYTILTPQNITFNPPTSPVTYGVKPIALSAKASSGLPIRFSKVSGPATVTGSTLKITGAGTVVVAANQAGNGTYAPAAQVTQKITVDKAMLTAVATKKSMTYGGVVPALTYTISGFMNGDTQAGATTGAPVLSTAATAKSHTGTYAISIEDGTLAASNYSFKFVPGTLTVNKANLTVTANNLTMKQGAEVPTLTWTMTGFVNGDTRDSSTTGWPALSTAATSKSTPGTYPVTVTAGTLKSSNYSFTLFGGTLTVTK